MIEQIASHEGPRVWKWPTVGTRQSPLHTSGEMLGLEKSIIWAAKRGETPAAARRLANGCCLRSRSQKCISKRCDKNVIVLYSYPFNMGRNGSDRGRCIPLKNIVECKVFRTRQNSLVFSGARGREFESPWARHFFQSHFEQFQVQCRCPEPRACSILMVSAGVIGFQRSLTSSAGFAAAIAVACALLTKVASRIR